MSVTVGFSMGINYLPYEELMPPLSEDIGQMLAR
jgi:hypothetical protein